LVSIKIFFFFFFFTLVTGPRRSLSLKLSDTKVYEPQIPARLGNHNIDTSCPFAVRDDGQAGRESERENERERERERGREAREREAIDNRLRALPERGRLGEDGVPY